MSSKVVVSGGGFSSPCFILALSRRPRNGSLQPILLLLLLLQSTTTHLSCQLRRKPTACRDVERSILLGMLVAAALRMQDVKFSTRKTKE